MNQECAKVSATQTVRVEGLNGAKFYEILRTRGTFESAKFHASRSVKDQCHSFTRDFHTFVRLGRADENADDELKVW